MAVIILKIPDKYVPKHKNVIDLRLHFADGHIIDADGCEFIELPDNMCTQRCCLKNPIALKDQCMEIIDKRISALKGDNR